MRVTAQIAGKWLEDPVTRAFLEAINKLREENVESLANGGCIGLTSTTTTESYYSYMGGLKMLALAADPVALMHELGLIITEEEENV